MLNMQNLKKFGDKEVILANRKISRMAAADNEDTVKQYNVSVEYTTTIRDRHNHTWEIDAHTEDEAEELAKQMIDDLEANDCDELDIDEIVIDLKYPVDTKTIDMFDAKNETSRTR